MRNSSQFFPDLPQYMFTYLIKPPYPKLRQYMLQPKRQYIDRRSNPSVLLEKHIAQLRLLPLRLLSDIIIPLQRLNQISLILQQLYCQRHRFIINIVCYHLVRMRDLFQCDVCVDDSTCAELRPEEFHHVLVLFVYR